MTVRIAFVHDTHTCYCVLFWFRFGYMGENCQTLSSGWGGGGGGEEKSLTQVCFNSNVKFHLTRDVTCCFLSMCRLLDVS